MKLKTLTAALLMSAGLGYATEANDTLSLELFRNLAATTEGNLAYSPTGVEAVLRQLKTYSAGETLAELSALPMSDKAATFNINTTQADALFVAQTLPLQPGVTDVVTLNFGQSAQAAQTINSWFSKHTNGLINKLVQASDFSALTAFVAANALYMKEKWAYPFNPNKSFPGEFTLANGDTIEVNMMSRTAKFAAVKGEDWVAIALPYAASRKVGNNCYFIAIRPTKDARGFASTLSAEQYNDILTRLRDAQEYGPTSCRIIMPSFTVDGAAMSLNDALQAAGLKNIFNKADFSKLTTTTKEIYLSKVMQKCYVSVNEEGTEAAAATAAIANFRSLPRTVQLDRPFIWIISDLSCTTTPLFMGIVEKP